MRAQKADCLNLDPNSMTPSTPLCFNLIVSKMSITVVFTSSDYDILHVFIATP